MIPEGLMYSIIWERQQSISYQIELEKRPLLVPLKDSKLGLLFSQSWYQMDVVLSQAVQAFAFCISTKMLVSFLNKKLMYF